MIRVKLDIFNTSFVVVILDPSLNDVLSIMTDELSTFSFIFNKHSKRTVKQRDKEFFSHLPHTNSYRFSINNLKDFMLLLGSRFVDRESIKITYDRYYEVEPLDIIMNMEYILRPYQKTYVGILTKEDAKSILLIDLQTGKGKSILALTAMFIINMKVGILIKPTYIEKTILDLKRYSNITDEDIYIVQGEASLKYILETGNDYKIVIFSTTTMGNLISDYENIHNYSLDVPPWEILRVLGIGLIFNDESHEEFHRVFKTILYLNPIRYIGSTATLISAQTDINKMYNVQFPPDNRISNIVGLDKYVNVVAVNYKLNTLRGVRYKGPKGYSHILFEQSILRNSLFLKAYVDMINFYVKESYINKRRPNDKIVIFVSTIRMATILTNKFKTLYNEFDVRRYVEDDPFENIMEAEICFTTQLSAGTGLDIPNLISVIQTVSTSSMQANLQNKGRLREIEGREVYYYYLYTTFIDKHKQYHQDRMKAIRPSSKTYIFKEYDKLIRIS